MQFNGCSTSQLYHRYPNPYIELKLIELANQIIMSVVFQENEFPSFLHSRNFKVQIAVLEFQLNAIFIVWKFVFLFSTSNSKGQKIVLRFSLI